MGTAEMVGSIGLTFFCNKCVEVFHKFRQDEKLSDELIKTCKQGISAFNSLNWPNGGEIQTSEKVSLFNTNEEIKSFERLVISESVEAHKKLAALIQDLKLMIGDAPLSRKKDVAHKLQDFFDTLGDYSFYATKECLRSSETIV